MLDRWRLALWRIPRLRQGPTNPDPGIPFGRPSRRPRCGRNSARPHAMQGRCPRTNPRRSREISHGGRVTGKITMDYRLLAGVSLILACVAGCGSTPSQASARERRLLPFAARSPDAWCRPAAQLARADKRHVEDPYTPPGRHRRVLRGTRTSDFTHSTAYRRKVGVTPNL
jgi:hypothetical protein